MDFETVKQLVDGFTSENPLRPDGKPIMFDIQIEVKNPTEMWHIPPDANLHMLKLCSVFSGVISDLLMKSAKPFGYEHMLLIRSPMKHLMKEFHRNSGKKA